MTYCASLFMSVKDALDSSRSFAPLDGRVARPHTSQLAAPARTPAAHALVAASVSHHDRAADVATWSVSHVDHAR
jgi:hypothetical protein